MLTEQEILKFINDDKSSNKKRLARIGQRYYEGRHDIKNYKLYYFDSNGELVEDKNRSNIKISHPFFTELVDQAAQYILSGKEGFVKSDIPELQDKLDAYFNYNEDFTAELYELLVGTMAKGFNYMYAYKKSDGTTGFQCADAMGVVEVRDKDTDDGCAYVIYWYTDRIEKGRKKIKRIQVWDKNQTFFYVQVSGGKIEPDQSEKINPRPHIVEVDDSGQKYDGGGYGEIPFFRMDNCRKQFSDLKPVKALIDDYDLMACGLSNNLQDASEYLVVVKGFQGHGMEEIIQNVRTKKHIGVDGDDGGDVDFKTVDIPYEARKVKLELDEKSIYRFGFGLNTAGLKDTAATTNIAIKAAYSLLDMKAAKLEIRLKQFLRRILDIVLKEINELDGTDYQQKDVYFDFTHEIMSNANDNAQIELINAQCQGQLLNNIMDVAMKLDGETVVQMICDILDIDYDGIKAKLNQDTAGLSSAKSLLEGVVPDDEAPVKEIKDEAEEITEKMLNGAQTQSLINVITQWKNGALTYNQAVQLICISIGVNEKRAKKLLAAEAIAGEANE